MIIGIHFNPGQRSRAISGQISTVLIFFVLMAITAISISFLYRMKIEQEAASNYRDALIAEYLARAGIERAIAELRNDTNHYDDLYEAWAKGFREELGEGYYDIQLISESDKEENVGIIDEESKININFAGIGPSNEGWTSFEINMGALKGLNKEKLKAILNYRYGPDGAPGKKGVDDDKDAAIVARDGIDNDADGIIDEKDEGIDEPDEFCPDNPYGDDNPFETVDEIRLVPGIGDTTFNKIKDYITIYSYDKNITREGDARVNINHAPVSEIARMLEKIGFNESKAAQIAVNIVDFRDEDNDPTEYKGKYGIERTPYINEVMPFFTSSAIIAAEGLAKGGIRYLKDKLKEKVKEKTKINIPQLDDVIDKITSKNEEKIKGEVDRIIKKYRRWQERKKKSFSLFKFFQARSAFAAEKASVKIDIEVEWVELFNPYSCICSAAGWEIKTSIGEKRIFGVVPPRGYWVVFNVVIKMPGKTIGKELLDNDVDTVELINLKGAKVDEVTYYNYGFPWRAFEKNDPRVREFAGTVPGGSPWFRNWYWMPRVGEVSPEQAYSSFYVKNKPFASIGEIGYIHSGKQWKTIDLGKNGDWRILDKITVAWPVEKPAEGKININTASREVLQSLPDIDSKLAEQIVKYCDSKDGPFDEIGEIARVRGMQKLGFNGRDDDGDGYVDEDDEKEEILRKISNLITVRSNCFTLICVGKVVRGSRVVAEKKIKAIVDRGTLPIRIKYYREIPEG